MQSIIVFGFGSFFRRQSRNAKDVDLLLLHQDCSKESIEFAIRCKALIRSELQCSDIVMLSVSEERDLRFLERSNATCIGTIWESDFPSRLISLVGRIQRKAPLEFI